MSEHQQQDQQNKAAKSSFSQKLRRYFLTGLVIILPLAITIFVLRFVLNWVNQSITPYIRPYIEEFLFVLDNSLLFEWWVSVISPALGLGILLILILTTGIIGSNVLGKRLIGIIEKIVLSIPFVRPIYSTIRQFLDTFTGDKEAFSKVVLFEYPRKGVWTMGLLTSKTRGEVQKKIDKELLSVFIPTTPNPTSGWLLFMPQEDVTYLDMSVDEAFKMIVSGGVVTPE